jgi:carbon storage regulator
MLVLSRRPGESIAIGDNIRLTIVEVSGDRVKVGIQAPQDVIILRQELCDAVEAENRAARQVRPEQVGEVLHSLRRALSQEATLRGVEGRDEVD